MSDELTLRQTLALREMIADLKQITDNEDPNDTNQVFVMDVMDRILSADTFEDIFAAQESGMTAGKDFVNVPFIVRHRDDVQWRRASQSFLDQGGFPFYAILRVESLLDGNDYTINCGGHTFVAVLYQLWTKGYFDVEEPRPLMIREVPTNDGKAYLQLVPYMVPTKQKSK